MIFSPRGPHPYPMMQAPPVIPKLYWGAISDEQRLMELWKCFDQLADRVNQLGYYYVPVFGGTWIATSEYAPLTVVEAPSGIPGVTEGDSYTALDYVPVGTPLTDERYWAKTGNYNAQVAALQAQVEGYDARIQQAQDAATQAQTSAEQAQGAADAAQSTADGKAPKYVLERGHLRTGISLVVRSRKADRLAVCLRRLGWRRGHAQAREGRAGGRDDHAPRNPHRRQLGRPRLVGLLQRVVVTGQDVPSGARVHRGADVLRRRFRHPRG